VDFADPAPAWTPTTESLNIARARADAILLPDGKVLVVGGADSTDSAWTPVLPSEMFDPATETFTVMASNRAPRMYHSESLLLPDARLVTSGSDRARVFGGPGGNDSIPRGGDAYEIYWPPYLFTSSGWAERPTIDAFADEVHYGLPTFVEYTAPQGTSIEEVVLVAPGSMTHGLNFSQRRVVCEFDSLGADTLVVTAPWAPEVAPPGMYLLFILTDGGVPSEGKFVKLSRATSTAQTGSETVWGFRARLDRDFTV
jgi:hypothetical protein